MDLKNFRKFHRRALKHYYRCLRHSFQHHSGTHFNAIQALIFAAASPCYERHSSAIQAPLQRERESGCTPVDAARPNCGDDHIATGKDVARPVGRDMHGAVGDEAVHD
uniref:Uncharacterized protein n=1 Tax=Vitis vinifera TaxID=29760 RepID=A5C055_VITVI|nr:hypothetical protein VITISV_013080 [Vitis vinifera]